MKWFISRFVMVVKEMMMLIWYRYIRGWYRYLGSIGFRKEFRRIVILLMLGLLLLFWFESLFLCFVLEYVKLVGLIEWWLFLVKKVICFVEEWIGVDLWSFVLCLFFCFVIVWYVIYINWGFIYMYVWEKW